MTRRIVWTEPAVNEVESIIIYWNNKNKSLSYGKKIKRVLRQNLKLLVIQPKIGRKTNIIGVRAKLILQHFFIIYKIGDNDEIVILNFWDCRQDPDLNNYK